MISVYYLFPFRMSVIQPTITYRDFSLVTRLRHVISRKFPGVLNILSAGIFRILTGVSDYSFNAGTLPARTKSRSFPKHGAHSALRRRFRKNSGPPVDFQGCFHCRGLAFECAIPATKVHAVGATLPAEACKLEIRVSMHMSAQI
jgi:hypothetical protein